MNNPEAQVEELRVKSLDLLEREALSGKLPADPTAANPIVAAAMIALIGNLIELHQSSAEAQRFHDYIHRYFEAEEPYEA
jgi:hypothetical protein